jgi:hypothetical protein
VGPHPLDQFDFVRKALCRSVAPWLHERLPRCLLIPLESVRKSLDVTDAARRRRDEPRVKRIGRALAEDTQELLDQGVGDIHLPAGLAHLDERSPLGGRQSGSGPERERRVLALALVMLPVILTACGSGKSGY